MIDKRLLFAEARRQGLLDDAEVRRQVAELEERLAIQALLAAEERRAGSAAEPELRVWFEAHRAELALPEQVRVVRVLAAVRRGASDGERTQARQRVQRLADRLRRGEPATQVAAEGDGPERLRGGDFGFVTRGRSRDAALEQASFALARPGDVSPVFQCEEGLAAVALVERQPARQPAFEEVRSEVENRLTPQRKRKVFDQLLERLRKDAEVDVLASTGRH